MQNKSTSHLQYADKEPSSATPQTSHSSQADARQLALTRAKDQTPFQKITPSRVAEPEPAAAGQDSLTAAWVAHVRREEGALPEQLYRSRREDTPVPSPSAEEAEVVQIDADARNSEEKSGPKV
jgi:hypothetical protein